jgi:hypothetical protein
MAENFPTKKSLEEIKQERKQLLLGSLRNMASQIVRKQLDQLEFTIEDITGELNIYLLKNQ